FVALRAAGLAIAKRGDRATASKLLREAFEGAIASDDKLVSTRNDAFQIARSQAEIGDSDAAVENYQLALKNFKPTPVGRSKPLSPAFFVQPLMKAGAKDKAIVLINLSKVPFDR